MKKWIQHSISIFALVAATGAYAEDGYVCDETGERKYSYCGAGWYLDESSSECIQCPPGFREGTTGGNTSIDSCVAYVDAGYYLMYVNKFGNYYHTETACPAGSYCPGSGESGFKYATGNVGNVSCQDVSQVTLFRLLYGAAYNSMFTYNMSQDVKNSLSSASGASSQEQCYFMVPAGKYLSTADRTVSYVNCSSGTKSAIRYAYLTTADAMAAYKQCESCGAGQYSADGKTCTDCGIAAALGLDGDVDLEIINKTTDGMSVCAYKLNNIAVTNGAVKNVQCGLAHGSYSCSVYNDTTNPDLAGYVGCNAGNVLYNFDGTGISGLVGDSRAIKSVTVPLFDGYIEGYYIPNANIASLKCESVRAGYVQAVNVGDNMTWDEAEGTLKGQLCPSGTYCEQGAKQEEDCPDITTFDGLHIKAESVTPATSINSCYIPQSSDYLYEDENGNRYSLEVDCHYQKATETE